MKNHMEKMEKRCLAVPDGGRGSWLNGGFKRPWHDRFGDGRSIHAGSDRCTGVCRHRRPGWSINSFTVKSVAVG